MSSPSRKRCSRRRGVDRVMRYAFELAQKRRKHLTSATKSNGIIHTMPVLGRALRRTEEGLPGRQDRSVPHRYPHRPFRPQSQLVRRRRRQQFVRRHPVRPRSGRGRRDRHRTISEPEPRAEVPVDVRAGPRLGARHRGPQHRQPDRHDLVGRVDARPLRIAGGARGPSNARSKRSAKKGRTRPILAARPRHRTWARRSLPLSNAQPPTSNSQGNVVSTHAPWELGFRVGVDRSPPAV